MLWVDYSFLVLKVPKLHVLNTLTSGSCLHHSSCDSSIDAHSLKRGFQEWFAPKAQRPSCIQSLPPSSRGLVNHRASFKLFTTHITPRTPCNLRSRAKTTPHCRAATRPHRNTRKDISSHFGLQLHSSCPCFQGQQLCCYKPTRSLIFLYKAKLYKENPHSLYFSNKHPRSGVTLWGTMAFLTAQETPEPTYSHHINILTYTAVLPTDTPHSFNTQLSNSKRLEIHTHRTLMQRRQIRKHLWVRESISSRAVNLAL